MGLDTLFKEQESMADADAKGIRSGVPRSLRLGRGDLTKIEK